MKKHDRKKMCIRDRCLTNVKCGQIMGRMSMRHIKIEIMFMNLRPRQSS